MLVGRLAVAKVGPLGEYFWKVVVHTLGVLHLPTPHYMPPCLLCVDRSLVLFFFIQGEVLLLNNWLALVL